MSKTEEGDGEDKIESAKVCFFTPLTWLLQRCLLTCGWKSSRSWSEACLSLMISTWHPSPPSSASHFPAVPRVRLELLPSVSLRDSFKHPSPLVWTSYCNCLTFVSDLNRRWSVWDKSRTHIMPSCWALIAVSHMRSQPDLAADLCCCLSKLIFQG